MRSIIAFFTKEHLFGNLLTLLVFLVGGMSLFMIRKEIFPKVDFDITVVSTVLPGASPDQIESLIINPIEESLREVDGIKKIYSTATENTGVIVIYLDPDSRSPDKTNRDIQLAIDKIDDLPEEALKPVVKVLDSGQQPVMEVTVGGDLPELEIRKVAKMLADELSLLPEVAKVSKAGYRKREFIIEADPKKMAQRRISTTKIINALKTTNISVPGGKLRNEKNHELLIRTDSEYKTMEEILDTVVVSNEEGYGTKIRDVATIRADQEEPNLLYRSNGKPSIDLIVIKKEKADALKLVEKCKERIDQLRDKIPTGVEVAFARDMTIYLTNRLSVLQSNVFQGLILVVFILTIFLPLRVSAVVSLGIPFAMFATFIVLYWAGYSINLISLMGFIIVIGMLVDDAIVISENVWRHVELEGATEANIIKGTTEVVIPVFASVMTTVLAFAPMLFMTGIFGKFIAQIPTVVILALIFSLFEAYFIIPSHFSSLVAPYIHKMKMPDPNQVTWFKKLLHHYARYVAWSTKHRYKTLGILIICFAFTGFIASQLKFVLFPPDGIEQFFIRLESEKETSLRQMEKNIEPIEKIIAELPKNELQDFITTIGIHQQDNNDPLTKRGSNYAQIFVEMTPIQQRERTAKDVIEELRAKIGQPKEFIKITFSSLKTGPPQGAPVSIDIKGQDFELMEMASKYLKERLAKIDGVIDIQDSFYAGKDQWTVFPKKFQAAQSGLSAQEIATTIRAVFDGVIATSVREYDEEIDIRLSFDDSTIRSAANIRDLKIGNQFGNLIPLKEVADIKLLPTRAAIIHNRYKRVINVSADVNLDKITSPGVVKVLTPEFSEIEKMFPGISLSFGGEDEDTKESMASLGRAFIISTLLILFVLILSFKSLIQPILILFSIPMGIMGVVFALFTHARPLSFMAMIGIIALAGVIVNNSIVYLEFVNSKRKEGVERFKSLVEAATTRLRPIILTTSTTLAGLMPTAYGDVISRAFKVGGADPFVIPLALALGWGLGFGSILNSLFFPAMVAIVDDLADLPKKISHLFKRKKHRRH